MQEFQTYFSTVAQISGGLVGLVFVALTFNPRTLGMRHDVGMRSLAEQVFADFLMVMVASLILLIPHFIATGGDGGISVAFIGLLGLARFARSVTTLIRGEKTLRVRLLSRFWLSLLGNAGFLAAGILLYRNPQASDGWMLMLFSPIALLVSGARSAWMLVTQNTE